MEKLVLAVKLHAENHYNDGGWDVIVECWSDDQIKECITGAKTSHEAIKFVAEIVSVFAERQADAEHSAF